MNEKGRIMNKNGSNYELEGPNYELEEPNYELKGLTKSRTSNSKLARTGCTGICL